MKDVVDWCTAAKPFRIKKHWKVMDQFLFTIKNTGMLTVEMFKINSISPTIASDIFLAMTENYYKLRQ